MEKSLSESVSPNCANCYFAFDDDGGGILQCRRHAPRPRVALHDVREPKVELKEFKITYLHWPVVDDDDWCGEWKHN